MVAQTLPDILTPEQVASYLQLDVEKVLSLIQSGQLIASSIDDEYRVQRRHIDLLLWNTQTRPSIVLREYSDEQIAEFLKEDELDDEAMEVVNVFLSMPSPRETHRSES